MTWASYALVGWPLHLLRIDLFLALFTAHLLGDFVLQTRFMVMEKNRFSVVARHAGVIAAMSYLIAGRWSSVLIPAVTWLTHAGIDAFKVRVRAKGATPFVVDQLAHLLVILALAWGAPLFGGASVWTTQFGKLFWVGLVAVSGVILTVRVGGFLVGFWVQPYLDEIQSLAHAPEIAFKPVRGLTNGGRLIGQWERALIFLFVGLSQLGSVGFLVAAKSIFRFGELKERENRMEAEYITIGTFMSFGWALAISYPSWWCIQKIMSM